MTYEEYVINIAQPFRDYISNGGDVDEYPGGWVRVDCEVSCQNTNCPRYDMTIRMSYPEQFNGEYHGFCGMCSDPVTGLNTEFTNVVFWGYQGEAFTS